MLIVETIAKVRRAYFSDGKSIKAICRELRLSRKVVRKVIRSGETSFSYERAVQPRPKLGQWTATLDELLEANAAKPAREQLTLIRIFEQEPITQRVLDRIMRIDDVGAGEDQSELALPFQLTAAVGSKAADIVAIIDFAQYAQNFRLGLRTHGEDRSEILEAEQAWIGYLLQQPTLGPPRPLPLRRARQQACGRERRRRNDERQADQSIDQFSLGA